MMSLPEIAFMVAGGALGALIALNPVQFFGGFAAVLRQDAPKLGRRQVTFFRCVGLMMVLGAVWILGLFAAGVLKVR